MLIALLVILILSLLLNLTQAVFLVRFRESLERSVNLSNSKIDRLCKELLLRLPQNPYGVTTQDRSPSLTIGPVDSRITH